MRASSWAFRLITIGTILWTVTGLTATVLAYDFGTSIRAFALIVAGLIVVTILYAAKIPLRWVAIALVLFAVAFAVYFLTQNDFEHRSKFAIVHALSHLTDKLIPDLGLHKPHPNIASGVFEVALPFAVLLTVQAKKLLLRILVGLSAFLLAYTLFMTESRGAWVAVVASSCLVALVYMIIQVKRQKLSKRTFLLGTSLIALMAVVGAIALIVVTLHSAGLVKSSDRLLVQIPSLELIADFLFTGLGMNSFTPAYSLYVQFHDAPPEDHAHNLWLNLWISQGVFGVLGYLLIIVGVALAVITALRFAAKKDQNLPGMFWATMTAWLIILIHGIVDDVHYQSWELPVVIIIPAMLLLVAQPFLVVVGDRSQEAKPKTARFWIVRAIPAAVVVGILVIAAVPLLSLAESNIGNLYQAHYDLDGHHPGEDLAQADVWLTNAWQTWTANPSAVRHAAMTYIEENQLDKAIAYQEQTHATTEDWPIIARIYSNERGNANYALKIDQEAVQLGTTNPMAYYVVASTDANLQQWQVAAQLQQRGVVLDSQPQASNYVTLGDLYAKLNNLTQARAAYQQALRLEPGNTQAQTRLNSLAVQE